MLWILPLVKPAEPSLVVGIWAGKETLLSRVKTQAETWMRFFPRIEIFSDEFPVEACQQIQSIANTTEIRCTTVGNLAEHLEDTEWTHRWYFAQPRFLPSMALLYEHNSDTDFFLFGDDDTYFIYPTIADEIANRSRETPEILGRFWCTWNQMTNYMEPKTKCHPFAQGGAGVLISNALMRTIAPSLRNCSLQFNDPDFAGSMRFALCAERIFGMKNWSSGKYIIDKPKNFNSSPPDKEIVSGFVNDPIFSFHRIKEKHARMIYNAHTMETRDGIIDLGLFAFRPFPMALGSERTFFEWRFGYAIFALGGQEPLLFASSPWGPVYDKEGFIGIRQFYGNEVEIVCLCDDRLRDNEVVFESLAGKSGFKAIFKMGCCRFKQKVRGR